ncbi:MAG: hypothetical protein P4M13_04020 [Alphaproteobacteria bacterium]|nr:hypothetical protein [Alphaproteobacteria bacterium]
MSRFFRSLTALFKPPFNGLGLVVVLYFAWAHLVYPHNDVLRGNLPDPDNYMYLTQTLDWLKGQGWYDHVQHRMNPPQGVVIHFSRFTQIPLAAGILFFEELGLPARGAAMLTALIEPLILLGVCLGVLRRTAARVVPKRWAGASAYVALFSLTLMYEFMPGQVGHHEPVIILVILCLGLVLRLFEEPENIWLGAVIGFILAFTLMIALESLPWALLLAAYLGVWSLKRGGDAARSGAAFALAFLVGNVVCLFLTRPLATVFDADILTYSIVYVVLAAAITMPFVGVALVPTKPSSPRMRGSIFASTGSRPRRWIPAFAGMTKEKWIRWLTGLSLAALSAAFFLHLFPQLAFGPYGAIDPRLVPILLDTAENAKPILKTENGWAHFYNLMSMGALALCAALAFFWRAKDTDREKWGVIVLLLASSIGLTIFYQYRFLGMESALAVIPLTALLQRGWGWIGNNLRDRKKAFAEIGLLLAIGPLPAVLIPALYDSRSFNTGVLLFPVEPGATRCDMARLEKILRNPYELGDKPYVILSQMELGPELLFRTDHSVLAAPYHMNVEGNVDAAHFLTTTDPTEAMKIARRRRVDLVVACRAVAGFYLPQKGGAPTFIEALFGESAPKGLERFPSAVVKNFVLYRVRPAEAQNDANAPQEKK